MPVRAFRELLLSDLVARGAVTTERARALTPGLLEHEGDPLAFLRERGVPRDEVLGAASTASGFPVAPRPLLEREARLDGADLALHRKRGTLPLARRLGAAAVAYANPERALLTRPGPGDDGRRLLADPADLDAVLGRAGPRKDATAVALEAFGAADLPSAPDVGDGDPTAPNAAPQPLAVSVHLASDASSLPSIDVPLLSEADADLDASGFSAGSGGFGDTVQVELGRPTRALTSQISSAVDIFAEDTLVADLAGQPDLSSSLQSAYAGDDDDGDDDDDDGDEAQSTVTDAAASPTTRFQIERPLYRDPACGVYLARDRLTGQDVTVELLTGAGGVHPALLEVRDAEERLRAASHPSLAKVWAVAESEGHVLVVTERFPGKALSLLAHDLGGLSPALAVVVLARMVRILASVHEHGVYISGPVAGGVVVTPRGDLALADLGFTSAFAARVRREAQDIPPRLLPPRSPSLAQGHAPSARSDLFAVGALGYEILTGRQRLLHELLEAGGGEAPPPLLELAPSAPLALDEILQRLTSPDPDSAYPAAQPALRDLEALVDKLLARHPGVMTALVDAPARERELRRAQAEVEVQLAEACVAARPGEACFRLYKASLIAPDDESLGVRLARTAAPHGFFFDAPDREVAEVDARLRGTLDPLPGLLQELGGAFQAEGRLVAAAIAYRRALARAPENVRLRQALVAITGT